MMYVVTAMKNVYEANGVEIAGIFDSKEKAHEVALKVIKWMEENEFENYEVFTTPYDVNHFRWYEINERI